MRLIVLLILCTIALAAKETKAPKWPKAVKCFTQIPLGRHNDYLLWPFNQIPRRWTAHASCKPPKTLIGNDHDLDGDDVPDPGHKTLQFSWRYGLMFSFQTKSRILFRIGTMRYDFVDHYYETPTFALKRHKEGK